MTDGQRHRANVALLVCGVYFILFYLAFDQFIYLKQIQKYTQYIIKLSYTTLLR